jgi:hypothetical protein
MGTEFSENGTQSFPGARSLKAFVGIFRPGFVLWLMKIDGP